MDARVVRPSTDVGDKRKNSVYKIRVKKTTHQSPYNKINHRSSSSAEKPSMKENISTRKPNPFTFKKNRAGPLNPMSATQNILNENNSHLYRKLSQVDIGGYSTGVILKKTGELSTENNKENIQEVGIYREKDIENINRKVQETTEHRNESTYVEKTTCSVKSTNEHAIPLDWCLKVRLRFTSNISFNALGKVTHAEESKSVANFTRCIQEDESKDMQKSIVSKFRQNLLTWVHPSSIFGCNPANTKPSQEVKSLLEAPAMRSVFLTGWLKSFRSLFNVTKTGYCPYFYIISTTFSCLFKAKELSADGISCVVTPTTKGFRNILKDEGIEFSMPLLRNEDGVKSYPLNDRNSDEESDEEFFESIGLSKNNFLSVQEKKLKTTRSELMLIDNRNESTIFMHGDNSVAFFNFVLGLSSFLDPTHSCSFEIPVLIAPTAFEGATLQSSKITQGPTYSLQNGANKKTFALDINGFILPTQFYNICHILQRNYKELNVVATNHRTTHALNVTVEESNSCTRETGKTTCEHFGLSNGELDYISSVGLMDGKQIESIKFNNSSISCTFK